MFWLLAEGTRDGSVPTALIVLVQGSTNLNLRRSEMSYWEISNEIDVISYRLSSIKDVAEIVAERITTDPESGAIWGIAEMIGVMEEKLMAIAQKTMELHRAEHAILAKPTKEKKK
jgi:hypothetical protein